MNGPQWTLHLGALPTLSQNQRLHWADKARLTRLWKTAAYYEAKRAGVPRLQRARMQLIYFAPDRRRRDADNLAPAAKAAVDGTVAAGVIPDDTPEHLVHVMPGILPLDQQGDASKAGEYTLVVVALEEDGRL